MTSRPLLRLVRAALASALAAAVPAALAAPCSGFSDVDDSETFCPAVEWLKNRSITLGCTTGSYCPNVAVTRASMALFLNRLGTALTPELRFVEDALDALDPDAEPVICTTDDLPGVPYPRRALVSTAFGGQSTGAIGYATRAVVSTNGGSTWSALTQAGNDIRESVAVAAWTSTAGSGVHAIPAAASVRYGMAVVRHGGTADFAQARCQVVAQVFNASEPGSTLDLP